MTRIPVTKHTPFHQEIAAVEVKYPEITYVNMISKTHELQREYSI